MIQGRRTHSEAPIGIQDEDSELIMTMLKVLNDFEEHRRILQELQNDQADLVPHWIPDAASESVGLTGR